LTSTQDFLWLDEKGKEIRSMLVGAIDFGCAFDVLPNGNLLVAEARGGLVVERDPKEKTVWKASLPGARSAMRLPNGNTLMASAARRQVVEVDAKGRTVWEHRPDMTPSRVQRR
jgi:hypothetical protein